MHGFLMGYLFRLQLHPFSQQREIVDYYRKHGIVVQAYSPLVRGAMDDPVITQVVSNTVFVAFPD